MSWEDVTTCVLYPRGKDKEKSFHRAADSALNNSAVHWQLGRHLVVCPDHSWRHSWTGSINNKSYCLTPHPPPPDSWWTRLDRVGAGVLCVLRPKCYIHYLLLITESPTIDHHHRVPSSSGRSGVVILHSPVSRGRPYLYLIPVHSFLELCHSLSSWPSSSYFPLQWTLRYQPVDVVTSDHVTNVGTQCSA